MAKIHDLFIVELAEVIKGYGNNPDDEDPFRLSEFYRFYELPNIAVSRENFEKMRPVEPDKPEVMSDGTLHITVDLDISKVDRILLSHNGTHYGNLYYVDDDEPERKTGKWIEIEVFSESYDIYGDKTWSSKMQCDQCGFRHTAIEGHMAQYNFCPNCGADMRGEKE